MPNAIKPLFNGGSSLATPNALTISLAPSGTGLASSTGGTSARQSTIVDNTTTRYQRIHVYPKITVGTTPTAGKLIYFWLIKDDGSTTPNRTDGAGASDAALTIKTATLLATAATTSNTSDIPYQPDFTIENPGPKWGIAVGHDLVAALNSTGSNHVITWVGETPEVA